MKRKLLLINPRGSAQRDGFATCKTTRFQPLGLAIVAALTPADHWDVKLVDENFEAFVFEPADLVALSAFTTNVNRAYEIAAVYRASHIPTIIGGIHASLLPDEAQAHVDTVVMGEAEGIWPRVLDDFLAGRLQRVYGPAPVDSFSMASPRRDVLRADYVFGSVQTTRGCPMDCDFCSVSVFNGRSYRLRPVNEVLDELETIPQARIFFVDDNLIGTTREHQERAIAIFKGMIERNLNKRWICQASINIADNEELLTYARRAGCRLVLVGVEAETRKALAAVNKRMNLNRLDNYEKAFRVVHRHGIAILGAFIFGMDNDDQGDILARIEYANRCGADVIQSTVLTPLPKTRVFESVLRAKRLLCHDFPRDWEKFTFLEVLVRPEWMSPDDLLGLMLKNRDITYSLHRTLYRGVRTLFQTKSLEAALWSLTFNLIYRRANLTSYKNRPAV